MQVNPRYIHGLVVALGNISAREQQLSAELSSGVRVQNLSEDPVAVGKNVILKASIERDDTFAQTATSSRSMLQVSDSALGGVVAQLTKAISVATQGNSGTLSQSNVIAIGEQLEGIRDQVVALANSTYLGKYLFSGSQDSTVPYALNTAVTPAVAAYQGDSRVSFLQTPSGQRIQLNLPGDQIFSSPGQDVLATLNKLVTDFANGVVSSSAQDDTTALNTVLNFVSQQRVLIDNSINRLDDAATYTGNERVQLLATQTNLMQADVAQISTQMSMAETQQTALSSVITALQKGSLFDYL